MAFDQRKDLAAGELIAATFGELRANLRPVLIYLAVIVALGLLAESAPASIDGPASFAVMLAYFGGLYLVFEGMLRNAGHAPEGPSRRFFRFAGLGFVVLFGVLFATNFFIIPGVIVAARWIMAPSILVGTQQGVFGSLGESWSLSSGNTLPIALALAALLLVGFFGSGVIAALGTAIGIGDLAGPLLLHVFNLLLVGLSVAVYRRLDDKGNELAAVFA